MLRRNIQSGTFCSPDLMRYVLLTVLMTACGSRGPATSGTLADPIPAPTHPRTTSPAPAGAEECWSRLARVVDGPHAEDEEGAFSWPDDSPDATEVVRRVARDYEARTGAPSNWLTTGVTERGATVNASGDTGATLQYSFDAAGELLAVLPQNAYTVDVDRDNGTFSVAYRPDVVERGGLSCGGTEQKLSARASLGLTEMMQSRRGEGAPELLDGPVARGTSHLVELIYLVAGAEPRVVPSASGYSLRAWEFVDGDGLDYVGHISLGPPGIEAPRYLAALHEWYGWVFTKHEAGAVTPVCHYESYAPQDSEI